MIKRWTKILCLSLTVLTMMSTARTYADLKPGVTACRYGEKDGQVAVEISISSIPEKTTSAEFHLRIAAAAEAVKSITWTYADLNTYVTDKTWQRDGWTEIALYLANDQSRTIKTGDNVALVTITFDKTAAEAAGSIRVMEALTVSNEGFKETKFTESEIDVTNKDAEEGEEPPDNPPGGGNNGGGGGGGSKPTEPPSEEAVPPADETTPPGDTKPAFSDISGHWAEEAIMKMAQRQLLSGYGDGTFKPDGKVTRAEFAVIIDRMMDLGQGADDTPFEDVEPGSWYSQAVSRLYEAGIIKGKDDTTFGTSDRITNEQIAVLLKRALDVQGLTLPKVRDYVPFEDEVSISSYASDAIRYLFEAGIINGSYNRLSPSGEASRAQVAAMIDRILIVIESN